MRFHQLVSAFPALSPEIQFSDNPNRLRIWEIREPNSSINRLTISIEGLFSPQQFSHCPLSNPVHRQPLCANIRSPKFGHRHSQTCGHQSHLTLKISSALPAGGQSTEIFLTSEAGSLWKVCTQR
jgi:hypothetical protein